MSCNSNTPNINKTFIIEPLSLTGGSPTLSACTSLYTNLIQSCSGDTTITMGTGVITFNSNVNGINSFTANTIEANTYLSGGTNILDIVNGNDTFVTGGTFNDVSDTLTLVRNDGASVVIGGLANYYVTGGTYNNNTGLITFDRNDTLSAFTVDLSTIDVNDTFVTGGTLVNTDLILNLNDGSSTSSIDLSGLEFTGNTSGTCISDIHVSNIHSCSPLRINPNDEGNIYFGSTSGVTIDLLSSSTGRLGVGTNTPNVELHVKGNSSILRLETTSLTNNNYIEFWDPTERKGFLGYVSTFNTDALFIRNEEDNADIIISTTNSGGTSITAINIDGNQNVELPNGNLDINGTLTIGKLGTGSPINNLGIDSIGNVVVGTTGDTDTNTFVTGGTLSGDDLVLEKNNGVDVNPIDLSGLVSGKTDLTLFNSHTGDTNNPHDTSFTNLTSTAHTHTISEVVNLQTELDGKTENVNFTSHTGDTTIHYTKSSINLSDLGSTAHTHTLSEITDFNSYSGDVQTQIDSKTDLTLFDTHTGDTSNPHQTSFSNLTSTAHTHTISDVINLQTELDGKLNVSEFNTYSGDVQTQIDDKLETSIFNSYTGSVVDVFVSSGNANSVTQQLSFTNTTGGTFNVTNSAALFSDNDVNVTGGTYNPSNGCVTFTTNSGTTFDVCGFVTGITDTFVTGGTLSGTDLILEKSNGVDVSGIDLSSLISGKLDITTFNTYTGDTQTILDSKTDNTDFTTHTGDTTIHYTKSSINLSDLGSTAHTHTISEVINLQSELDGKTDLTQFNTHTGDTSNPHQTSFSGLISTAHTHTISEVVNLQTELDSKTDNTDFTTHTGDTTIHFTKSSINLSDLGSTAHTHTLSEITDFNSYSGSVQTQIDGKTDLGIFNSHTGDTSNPHQTSFSNLTSTAHTHTLIDITDFNSYSGSVQTQIDSKLNISDFNIYSGNVQTQLDTKIGNGINSGGANEVFSGKSGTDLYFRTISGGSNTTITTIDDIIKVDVSVPVGTNTFVTGFTYDNVNTFTISRNGGLGDLTSTISVLSGITYYGDGSNLSGISSSDFYVTGGTFSAETLTLDRNDGGSVVVTGFTSQPSLNNGEIFVGDTGNTAQSVAMTGDVNIDNTGVTTIQPDSVTYDKIQDVSQAAILGSSNTSGGTVTEIPTIDLYLTTGSITTLLENTSNWDINGNYTGGTITGTYQGQNHYDGNYFFTAVDDNVWIRLIRG